MKTKNYPYLLFTILITNLSQELIAQATSPPLVSKQYADVWSATDDLQRSLPLHEETGNLKKDKFVGIFYFTWLGAHGHDQNTSPLPDEGVQPKKASDTLSPYDITKILKDNPKNPVYGPELAFHHWAEPYFGYYLTNDEWVIMKHAQLLSDAGIDVIVFDVTNALAYLPQVEKICEIFSILENKGWAVPKIAFLTNTNHIGTTEKIYDGFYKKKRYQNLWFYWKGKPLLMGNKEGLKKEIVEFFNFRRSWAWTDGQDWFGDGKDKWPWIDHYPQNFGWHDSQDKPEQIVVSTAQHPISNIGRSFHDGHQPSPDSIQSGKGLFFEEQWQRALAVNPEFVFITGWNEWIAMRFNDGKAKKMMGKPIADGETYFVDQYNAEFSRDIEPMKDGFRDNYYYQMVSNIRKFKGTREMSFDKNYHEIKIDGQFEDWIPVNNIFFDHKGDTESRNHPGWGRIDSYTNFTGRNDFVKSKVAETNKNLFFYIEIANDFENTEWPENLTLMIDSSGKNNTSWEGFEYRITYEKGTNDVVFQINTGGWNWKTLKKVKWNIASNKLETTISKSLLNLNEEMEIAFKWLDNVNPNGEIMKFYDHGDVAPNSRFKYRYELIKPY